MKAHRAEAGGSAHASPRQKVTMQAARRALGRFPGRTEQRATLQFDWKTMVVCSPPLQRLIFVDLRCSEVVHEDVVGSSACLAA
mmetsp:Transcript_15238/g.32875  ORF Transcript_15238/g.32875 Transcript_15238/m.32875 type:complete len:84 (+) Transcript_15238:695-946(+)